MKIFLTLELDEKQAKRFRAEDQNGGTPIGDLYLLAREKDQVELCYDGNYTVVTGTLVKARVQR